MCTEPLFISTHIPLGTFPPHSPFHNSIPLAPFRNTYKGFTLIDKYIVSKYLKTFFLSLALICIIIITFDVSEKMDDFLSEHAPLKEIIFDYYLNFIPGFVSLYSPLFIFISVIFFTSKMAGNTEIIAILGSGISYLRMLRPYMIGSFIIASIVLVLGNFIIPNSNRTLVEFDQKYLHTRHKTYYDDIHFQSEVGTQVYASSYDVSEKQAFQFHQDRYDEDKHLIDRITAERISYDSLSGNWIGFGYTHRTIDGMKEHFERSPQITLELNITPDDFNEESQHIEMMNSPKLYQYIKRERMRGSSAVVAAQIEFYQRLFTPLAIFIMTLIGVAVSSNKSRGGIGAKLAIGISLAFAFIIFMRISTVFSTNGNLSPALAVLTPQIIFGIAAVFLIYKSPK